MFIGNLSSPLSSPSNHSYNGFPFNAKVMMSEYGHVSIIVWVIVRLPTASRCLTFAQCFCVALIMEFPLDFINRVSSFVFFVGLRNTFAVIIVIAVVATVAFVYFCAVFCIYFLTI